MDAQHCNATTHSYIIHFPIFQDNSLNWFHFFLTLPHPFPRSHVQLISWFPTLKKKKKVEAIEGRTLLHPPPSQCSPPQSPPHTLCTGTPFSPSFSFTVAESTWLAMVNTLLEPHLPGCSWTSLLQHPLSFLHHRHHLYLLSPGSLPTAYKKLSHLSS